MAPAGRTLIIDRTFVGVGRIKRATGTTQPAVRRKLSRMLDALADENRADLLRAIRDGDLSLLEVHAAYQRKALHELPTADTARTLEAAMQAWLDGLVADGPTPDCSAKHKVSLGQSRKYLRAAAPKAAVADLPRVLEGLRDTLGRKHPRSFNLVRSAALAFVRDTLKRSHPLWLAVSAVEARKAKPTVRHAPQTPAQLRERFPDPMGDPLDAIAWGMALTGMGPGEYWGTWAVLPDRVHIAGTKRAARVRDVPLVAVPGGSGAPEWPAMHPRTFADKLALRTDHAVRPYDLRRTYATWLEAAGVTRSRRMAYLGHAAGDVTAIYERHEVDAYLTGDAEKLAAFLSTKDGV